MGVQCKKHEKCHKRGKSPQRVQGKIFFGFASEKIVRGFLTSQRTRPYRKSPGLLLTLNIEQCSPNDLKSI